MDVEHPNGHIYLLQTRESIERNEPIYKLGRTNKAVNHRFSQYPKRSKLIYYITCRESCVITEHILMKLFKEQFDRCERSTLYGKEYFRGDVFEMIELISNTIHNMSIIENSKDEPAGEKHEVAKCEVAKCEPMVETDEHTSNNRKMAKPVQYKCERCPYTTNRKSNLDNHLKRKNPCYVVCQYVAPPPPVETNRHKFQCSKCDKILSSKLNLKNHEKTCDGLHPLQCKICLKMFASKQSKYWHTKNVKCTPANETATSMK